MREIHIGGRRIEVYEDIEQLPIERFHKYNKLMLVDSGIGSDLADFDRHLERAMRYVGRNAKAAEQELRNLRQCVWFIQENISPRHMAFAALVKSIDGEERDDISDEALKKTMEMLGKATKGEVEAALDAAKKKIDSALRLYFPGIFESAEAKEWSDLLKRRTMLVLKGITEGKEESEKVDELTGRLMTFHDPQDFSGPEGVEVQQDKSFESMCLLLSQELHVTSKELSVLAYYNAYEYIRKLDKERKKRQRRK